jgi:hypothetical protein
MRRAPADGAQLGGKTPSAISSLLVSITSGWFIQSTRIVARAMAV